MLLLVPGLLQDMKKLGLRKIAMQTGLSEQEVTNFYFQTASIMQSLPASPEDIDPKVWPALLERARLMTLVVGELSREELLRAKEQAIQNFLPQARQEVQSEYKKRLEQGDLDFHLAGLAREESPSHKDEDICMEAIRLEREQCYGALMKIATESLNPHQACIVKDAKAHAREQTLDASNDLSSVDLLVHLGALLSSLLTLRHHPDLVDPDGVVDHDIDHVVMGMGNILYRGELGFAAPVTGRIIG
ncbi:hypothetical protein BG841_14710 [Marinobacter sp. X15-166B]|nr:hypothetical protein BG841_14710 [Marinobacter sp. X15-166B]